VTQAREVEKLLKLIESGNRVDFGIVWRQDAARGKKLVADTFRLVAR
jgi:ABC-type molybdate transport system substrate-binding protein